MSPTPGTWLDDWLVERNAQLSHERRLRDAEDPGIPAYYGTCTGQPTVAPVSYVAAAREKLRPVFNLDRLHRNVLRLLGQNPL